MKHSISLMILLAASACNKDGRELPDPDTDTSDVDTGDSDTSDPDSDSGPLDTSGPRGFIGSPCDSTSECTYEGAVCLTEAQGFPGGMCSVECDRFCPDEAGFPTTFCVDGNDLVESPLAQGSCASQCDFGVYDDDGCRDGYGCVVTSRFSEQQTERYTCLPNAATDLSDEVFQLAERGLDFTPTLRAPEAPSTHPNLRCIIENPVVVHPPIGNVDIRYYDGTATPNMTMSATAAHALIDIAEDVGPRGVDTILHIGTYNCRVIGGTNTLSRHGLGDAIDIYGFEFTDGQVYTLVDDWIHTNSINTPPPSSDAGATFMWEAAHRWHDQGFWNIILTPQFNAAHDNHFHIDMTPGSSMLRSLLGTEETFYLGPAPYVD